MIYVAFLHRCSSQLNKAVPTMNPCGTPEITFRNLLFPLLCKRFTFYLKDSNVDTEYVHVLLSKGPVVRNRGLLKSPLKHPQLLYYFLNVVSIPLNV